jgi:hypothetical protein
MKGLAEIISDFFNSIGHQETKRRRHIESALPRLARVGELIYAFQSES